MKFIIALDLSNDAFTEEPTVEVARILQRFAAFLRESYPDVEDLDGASLRDSNGNSVGRVSVEN
jgi:hypothetical protein